MWRLAISQAEIFSSEIDQQLSKWLGAIPVLVPIFQRLNVEEIINRYTPCKADIDSGTVALILAMNRLMMPRPLYKVADWLATTVLPETLGIPAEKLHDRRIGDLLDAIHKNLHAIWKEIVHRAIKSYGINIDLVHYDITSIYKGSIRIRPILLHKQSRIESLVFICMVALLTFSILEMSAKRVGIAMTATAIFEQFASLSAVYTFFNDGSFTRQSVPLTEFQQQFIQRLQLPKPINVNKSLTGVENRLRCSKVE